MSAPVVVAGLRLPHQWSRGQREFANELLGALGVDVAPEAARVAFERFFARAEAEASRYQRDQWADRLLPRERLLSDLLDAVVKRTAGLDAVRSRLQRARLREAPAQTVLYDGFNSTEVVYGLVDPQEPTAVRYVGRTDNPVARYRAHITAPSNRFFAKWIEGLTLFGRSPIMLLVERCSPMDVNEREAHWIAHYRSLGQADLNMGGVYATSNTLPTGNTVSAWTRVTKFDREAVAIVDGRGPFGNGEPHYSRRKPGAPQFMPPGQTIILMTPDRSAVWGWWRPDPNAGVPAMNGLDGWTCTLFRNDRGDTVLSSALVLAAEQALVSHAGECGTDGMLTYVKRSAVRSANPGYCYKVAGWRRIGRSADRRKDLLQKPFALAGAA